jgi:hypothetical protein
LSIVNCRGGIRRLGIFLMPPSRVSPIVSQHDPETELPLPLDGGRASIRGVSSLDTGNQASTSPIPPPQNVASSRPAKTVQSDTETEKSVTTKEAPRNVEKATPDLRPRNLKLAFIGDSVTRFQYTDLVYYLMTNRWVEDGDKPMIVRGPVGPATWKDNLLASNLALSPYEECDCFRETLHNKSAVIENRYFRDEELGNYVTFILKFGSIDSHGRWEPEEVYSPHGPLENHWNPSEDFRFQGNWSTVIREHVAKLQPKPEYLVFNAGLHRHDLNDPEVQLDIQEALREANITGIYRTTTFKKDKNQMGQQFPHDSMLCGKVFPLCLDFGWTKELLGEENYFDNCHFKPHVKKKMNLQLLDFLKDMTKGKKKLST